MLKLIFNDSQENLVNSVGGEMMQFIPFNGLVKSASDGFPKGVLEQYKPDKDHFAIHWIGVGDYENWGCNRNGDAFRKAANQEYHPCFVKFGKFYRHHKNTPEFAIGEIKASCHNAPMGRIELIVHGHKKTAEEEYELVKAGKQLYCSMSCKVPYDVCSICENQAPSRAQYCSHARDEMCRIYPNGKQAFVFNPKPYYFDISRVFRPADRTAWALQTMVDRDNDPATMAAKEACDHSRVISGAELAKIAGLREPELLAVVGDEVVDAHKLVLVQKLAEIEAKIDHLISTKEATFGARTDYAILHEYSKAFMGEGISDAEMNKLASVNPSDLFRGMADRGIIFSFPDFVRYVKNVSKEAAAALPEVKYAQQYFLPALFSKFGCQLAHDNMFDANASGKTEDGIDQLMDSISERHGLEPAKAKMRMVIMSIDCRHGDMPKTATDQKSAENMQALKDAKILAEFYGLYKISALGKMSPDSLNEDLLTLAVMQNKMNP